MDAKRVHELIVESGIGERIRQHIGIREGRWFSMTQLTFSYEERADDFDAIVVDLPNRYVGSYALWPTGSIGFSDDPPMTENQQQTIKRIRLSHDVMKVLVVLETLSHIPADEQIEVSQEELTLLEKGYQNLRKRLGLSD